MQKVKIKGINYWKISGDKILEEMPKILKKANVLFSTLHWSAGSYTTLESDYQILIAVDNFIYIAEDIGNWAAHQHTWHRNTGNIGMSFMAMFNKFKYPVTDNMIENGAKAWAVIKKFYKVPWEGFHDHYYYSNLDHYEPKYAKIDCNTVYLENGKLITLFQKTLQKAKWYFTKYP